MPTSNNCVLFIIISDLLAQKFVDLVPSDEVADLPVPASLLLDFVDLVSAYKSPDIRLSSIISKSHLSSSGERWESL